MQTQKDTFKKQLMSLKYVFSLISSMCEAC